MPAPVDELLSRRLAALPCVDGGPDGWVSVQSRLQARRAAARRIRRSARLSMAASVAVLAAIVAFALMQRSPSARPESIGRAAPTATEGEIERLRAQSVALEEVLAALPERPAVARAATAVPIDTLEAQVQWLDHQLSMRAGRAAADDAALLWRERVETMSSLVRLRYAEAQQLAM